MSLIFFATPLSHLNWLAEEACIVLCVFVYLCFCVLCICHFFLPHLIRGGSYCASRKMKHQFDCNRDFFSKTEPRTIFKPIIVFFVCERLNDKYLMVCLWQKISMLSRMFMFFFSQHKLPTATSGSLCILYDANPNIRMVKCQTVQPFTGRHNPFNLF